MKTSHHRPHLHHCITAVVWLSLAAFLLHTGERVAVAASVGPRAWTARCIAAPEVNRAYTLLPIDRDGARLLGRRAR